MNEPLTMTPQELILYVIGGVIAISVGLEKLAGGFRILSEIVLRIRRPNQIQDEEIEAHSRVLAEHEKYLKNDNGRLVQIESWISTNDKVIRDHDSRLTRNEDSLSLFRQSQEVQLQAMLSILQALGKSRPEDADISKAQEMILQFLSHSKMREVR